MTQKVYVIGHFERSRRLDSMNVATPHKLKLLATVDTTEPKQVEKELHDLCPHFSGEWFCTVYSIIHSLQGLDVLRGGEIKSVIERGGVAPENGSKSLYVQIMEKRL